MATEIERKFLLRDDAWRAQVVRAIEMQQGYLSGTETCSVRARIEGDRARLNVKGATLGIERLEFEYDIPLTDARAMLENLCGGRSLHKTRHFVPFGDHTWEIDEFRGDNAGLVVAEIELGSVDEAFDRPAWLGSEVSHDVRYYNVKLIEQPYCTWPDRD